MYVVSVCCKAADRSYVVGGPPALCAGMGRVFFVSVNQVLVRLWARRKEGHPLWVYRPPYIAVRGVMGSSSLTGKRGVMSLAA